MSKAPSIVFNEPLHTIGEELHVPSFAVTQALGWRISAELVRRHPGFFDLKEDHPHSYGMAIVVQQRVTSAEAGAGYVSFVLHPHLHITPIIESYSWDNGRFNWLEVLLTPNRRAYIVEQLEMLFSLPRRSQTPATVSSSIGSQVIASFLSRTALDQPRWTMNCGVVGSDYGSSVRTDLFESMPSIKSDSRKQEGLFDRASNRQGAYWFLRRCTKDGQPKGSPIVAVDIESGIAWTQKGRIDLMEQYRHVNRSVDALTSAVFPPAF